MAAQETHAHTPHARHDAHEHPEQGVKDPVCGMTVDPHTAKHRHTHNGRPYYFCSAGCREKFVANPTQYLEPEPRIAQPVPAGTIYTCPMHPADPATWARRMSHLRYGARAGGRVG